MKYGHIEVNAPTELSWSLDSHLKNKVVEKPGITFEDQSIETLKIAMHSRKGLENMTEHLSHSTPFHLSMW